MRSAAIILLLAAVSSAAKPLAREEVPKPLAPWVDWVLRGHEETQCPFFQGQAQQRACAWPGRLALSLDDRGGGFSQTWQVFAEAWAALPGDEKRWPQDVLVDGKPAAVVEREGVPQVLLPPGGRSVTGRFRWKALPELLKVPAESGLLSLTLRGKPVSFPVSDGQGRLWLQKTLPAESEKARLEVAVHRHVLDDIPLRLTTLVELKVSGKSREVLLGRALPEGFEPMSLTGPLPARLEPGGRLRVQARPGTWTLTLTARHEGLAERLGLPEAGGPWDDDEVWVFESRNELRLVSVEGALSVDPQQTELPSGWRAYPAYLMRPGGEMTLVERRRGDADPEPDRLALARTLWLDFDGRGYSVQDRVSGTLHRSWRLEMAPETSLGRVSVDGRDQFITSLATGSAAGVEIRQGAVRLAADSRVEGARGRLPAVGWNHDFDKVSAVLQLPPGWRLLHAFGVDRASPTWLSRWTLLDFFLALVIAFSAGRLWGRRAGALALAAVALSWQEPLAPRWIWLFVFALEALARALPEGSARRGALLLRGASWGLLVLLVVPFAVVQVRQALYPQLELRDGRAPYRMIGRAGEKSMNQAVPQAPPAWDEKLEGGEREEARRRAKKGLASVADMAQQAASEAPAYNRRLKQSYAPDPNSVVNTGPGLPAWSWRSVSLAWQGPVKKEQELRLWLLSPRAQAAATVLRLAALGLLLLVVIGLPLGGGWRRRLGLENPGALALAALLLPPAASAAEFPPQRLLDDLRGRLVEPPECAPRCAESPRMRLEVSGGSLRARVAVNAVAPTAVPLPGGAKQWSPTRVLLGAEPARGLRRSADGQLWLALPKGSHQVLIEGPLPDRETVQLPLPLKPRRLEAAVSGWTLEGVNEDGVPDGTLQLSRARADRGGELETLESGVLPPFVSVTRRITLDLSWHARTTVERLTPAGHPIVLEVPLLPGESVTTEGLRVSKGRVLVNMSPQSSRVSWTSTLSHSDVLELAAPREVPWVEAWLLDVSPVWHAETRGIPTVHAPSSPASRTRHWRPWPGEGVEVRVRRPEGVPGQTLTVDRSAMAVTPGLRATDVRLELSLRSSRGGQHAVELPEGAELQSVAIDGTQEPIRQEGRRVTLPIRPGAHAARLEWRQEGGIGLLFRTPRAGLGLPSVNAGTSVSMPANRWMLLAAGPRLGPAVLFWSLLAVFLLASLALGSLEWTPLSWRQWFLLSLGLTQVPIPIAAFIAAWLIALGWRRRHPPAGDLAFNLVQLLLAGATVIALACLFGSIAHGLLGYPDMQVSGNGSTARQLLWYQDRTGPVLPRAFVLSVPLMLYRAAMLLWALWLASSLLGWLKWGWACCSEGGLWRGRRPPPAPRPAG